ncbi:hypothetical protein [Mycobacterium uberis]|nr:hypothetical protein [Mycobacterium uberis]
MPDWVVEDQLSVNIASEWAEATVGQNDESRYGDSRSPIAIGTKPNDVAEGILPSDGPARQQSFFG